MIIAVREWKADGFKRSRRDSMLLRAVHPPVFPAYVEKFYDSGMKRNPAKTVWNRFKTESADPRVVQSIDEQRAFVRDGAGRQEEAKNEETDAVDNRNFEKMVSVDKVTTSGARGNMKEILRILGTEAMRCRRPSSK